MSEDDSSDGAEGQIFYQDPAEGESIEPGSAVAVTVSLGPEQVEVPDIFGLSLKEAQDALASAGLYGVVSYLVSTRAREVAIRMALGAVPHRILTMILGQSMRLVGFGVVIGGLAAYIITQLVRASEFQGTSLDIVCFVGSAATLTLAMLIASAVPALRAARFDPVANLKEH